MSQRYIWKFQIEVTDEQLVTLPMGSKILSVGEQFGDLYLWVYVRIDTEPYTVIDRKIRIFGTGHLLPEDAIEFEFIGTVITDAGNLVWHVFDEGILSNTIRSK